MYSEEIIQAYGNNIRVRACGVLIQDSRVLLVKQAIFKDKPAFWAFPGGGVEANETLKDAVKREFLEETHLEVSVEDYIDYHEFIEEPLHAVEFFFRVKFEKGNLELGMDPELNTLVDIAFFEIKDVLDLKMELADHVVPILKRIV
ncbi:MAG: NUDIX domain-containing protein [Leadbetterella sp.]